MLHPLMVLARRCWTSAMTGRPDGLTELTAAAQVLRERLGDDVFDKLYAAGREVDLASHIGRITAANPAMATAPTSRRRAFFLRCS